MPKKSGFTLIELLMVVVVISILSLIGLTVFANVQKNARDAARKSDIDAIGSALEAHYTFGSSTPYPAPLGDWFNSGAIPKDPQGSEYFWNGAQSVLTSAVSTYTLCALLENKNGNSSSVGNGTIFTSAGGDSATHYCRKNLQ